MNWDHNQGTYYIDVPNVGRYAVKRLGKRQPYAAYLNGERIALDPERSLTALKERVEARIAYAKQINTAHEDDRWVLRRPTSSGFMYFSRRPSESWTSDVNRAHIDAAQKIAPLLNLAERQFPGVAVEMILLSAVLTKRYYFASWACVDDLDTDRSTMMTLTSPVGVIIASLGESAVDECRKRALADWSRSTFPPGHWLLASADEGHAIWHYVSLTPSPYLIGVLHISPREVIA